MLYLFITVKRESQTPSTILSNTLFEIDDHLTFQELLQQADCEYQSHEIVKVEIRCVGSNQYYTVASDGLTQSVSSCNQSDAFNIMMERSIQHSLPPPKS
ncbi:19209_t:CDS:2, partial [Racocetra persica]